jgi:hypothetical protein
MSAHRRYRLARPLFHSPPKILERKARIAMCLAPPGNLD